MSHYLQWARKTITDFSDKHIDTLYNQGYVFTRVKNGVMDQTRSARVDVDKFELSNENRRILRKTEGLTLSHAPLPHSSYHWTLGKLAHDFYEEKFGKGIFSANKAKEIMTDAEKSNFNCVLVYTMNNETVGYCIGFETDKLFHYSYPFYGLKKQIKNLGMGMMLRAIEWTKKQEKKYMYLGSFQRPTDTYKLQFKGSEWFDGNNWNKDMDALKTILKQ